MILYSGLMSWYLRDMEATILDLEVGDVQIHAPEYRDDPSLYSRIDDAEALVAELRATGYRVTERLLAYGMRPPRSPRPESPSSASTSRTTPK